MKLTTADRLKYIMELRGLRQADILEMIEPLCKKYDVKIPRNALSQYVTGKVLPRQDKLSVLAMALNVSEAWLMGFDVPMEREESTPVQQDGRTGEFVRLFQELDAAHQETLLQVLRGLLAEQKACRGSRE